MTTSKPYLKFVPGCSPLVIPAGTQLEKAKGDTLRISRDFPDHPYRTKGGSLLEDVEFAPFEVARMEVR